jgi:hypothetical protein
VADLILLELYVRDVDLVRPLNLIWAVLPLHPVNYLHVLRLDYLKVHDAELIVNLEADEEVAVLYELPGPGVAVLLEVQDVVEQVDDLLLHVLVRALDADYLPHLVLHGYLVGVYVGGR